MNTKPNSPHDVCRATESNLRSYISELQAARIAYASEFPPDDDGDPDVGNIHANIRALKKENFELEAALVESRANDRTAMGYLSQVREIVGGVDFPDMVKRVDELQRTPAAPVVAEGLTAEQKRDCIAKVAEAVVAFGHGQLSDEACYARILATHPVVGSPAEVSDKHLPGWERGIATVTMNGHQLREALEFIAPGPDADPDELENELTFGIVQHADDDGKVTTGLCCWNDDTDGVMPLDDEPPAAPTDAKADDYTTGDSHDKRF